MKRLFILIMVTLFVAGCSTTTIPTETYTKQKVPKWYVDHDEVGKEGWIPFFRTDYVYAVGSSFSDGHDEALLKATLKAKTRLADKIVGQLSHKSTMKYAEQGSLDRPTSQASLESVTINEIRNSVLYYYEVVDKMTFRNVDSGKFHSYVLVKITKKNLDKIALLAHN